MKKSAKRSASQSSGQIRLISGQYRGRKLPVLDQQGLRPTTDRVKETLFNWLMHDVVDSRCLDCFAGSGSLGMEALSRHAAHVSFMEMHGPAAQQLQKNLATLKVGNADVQQGDSLRLLSSPPKQAYDLVFIDPPFRKNLIQPVVNSLSQHNWLNEDALVYIETETDGPDIDFPENWQLLKQKQAGQVSYSLYQLT